MRIRMAMWLAVVLLVFGAPLGGSADAPHGMYTPDSIKWGDASPMLPKGSKVAVLYGDPGKDGLFIIRAKLPANYRIPAHSHPTDEIVTVLSGSLTDAKFVRDEVFGLEMPTRVPDVPDDILIPRNAWKDKAGYDATAAKLAGLFNANFEKYAAKAGADVRSAAPRA